ncbi:IclR family transcriptional regulator [Frigidibacter oleivorans]|uniref:IclR family transcriptional regulator n=1 Tax=Frigidibacter oleivorans TaxID=2487129 RepID=UPI0013DFCD0A|nr:IclR family transcriptional regulator [Frigidibacter oleivorans]
MTTVDKAMTLLRQFSLERLEIGLNELARMTGEDKAVVRRILVSLMKSGFIEQNPENQRYFLGSGFLALARLREATIPMVRATQIVSAWLCRATNETVHVSIAGQAGMSTVAYNLPPRGNVINLRPADRYPFHSSSSGLAYLAYCTPDTQERLLELPRERLTHLTVTDPDELRVLFARTRAAGYACTRNTVEVGVASVAMPFFLGSADPSGTIAIAVPDLNLTPDHEAFLVESLRTGVGKLETALVGGPNSEQAPEDPDD